MANRQRHIGRTVPFVLFAGLVLLAAGGCDIAYGKFSDDKTETVSITEIQLNGGSGDLTVTPGAKDKLEIHRTVSYWSKQRPTVPAYQIDGSVLRLDSKCGNRCTVSYQIHAPEGVKVDVKSDSGDIRLTGVSTVDISLGSGDVDVTRATATASGTGTPAKVSVRTGSGDLKLDGIATDLTAHTASGDIKATGIRAGSTDVKTSFGDITLELGAAGTVLADSGSGDVTLAVPASGSYQVQADSGSGSVHVGVQNAPTGTNQLTLRTGSGDITVKPA
jgi:hypothetical protein